MEQLQRQTHWWMLLSHTPQLRSVPQVQTWVRCQAHLGELDRAALPLATAPVPLPLALLIPFVFSTPLLLFLLFLLLLLHSLLSLLLLALPSRFFSAIACAQTLDGRMLVPGPPHNCHTPPSKQALLRLPAAVDRTGCLCCIISLRSAFRPIDDAGLSRGILDHGGAGRRHNFWDTMALHWRYIALVRLMHDLVPGLKCDVSNRKIPVVNVDDIEKSLAKSSTGLKLGGRGGWLPIHADFPVDFETYLISHGFELCPERVLQEVEVPCMLMRSPV